MTLVLPVEAVIAINARLDCVHSVTDRGALEAAVYAPFAEFGGVEAHPTIHAKAAALLRGIVGAHPFFDGNKRTGWQSCTTFLALNGAPLRYTDEADDLVVALAKREIDVDEVTLWLVEHQRRY